MRQPFAELNEASRGAVDGDVISIDITGRHIGEDDSFFERSDLSYEVGTGSLVEDLDENVRGKAAGDSFDFEIDHADHDHPEQEGGRDDVADTADSARERGATDHANSDGVERPRARPGRLSDR